MTLLPLGVFKLLDSAKLNQTQMKMIIPIKIVVSGFELAICESRFVNQLCLFADHFKQCFMKVANQNFPSLKIC